MFAFGLSLDGCEQTSWPETAVQAFRECLRDRKGCVPPNAEPDVRTSDVCPPPSS